MKTPEQLTKELDKMRTRTGFLILAVLVLSAFLIMQHTETKKITERLIHLERFETKAKKIIIENYNRIEDNEQAADELSGRIDDME